MSADRNPLQRSKPKFDPTINYGHLFTIASFILGGRRCVLRNAG
jgi:hypothetical protein